MSRANLRVIMLLLAMNATVFAAPVLFVTYGIRDAAVFIVIVAMLGLAYLLRRRARAQLLYNQGADRPATAADWARRDANGLRGEKSSPRP